MFTTSHALSGVLVLRLLNIAYPNDFRMNAFFIMFSVLFANLPDIDVLWAKKLRSHHNSLLHRPLFWVVMTLVIIVLAPYTPMVAASMILLFFLQTIIHLLLDYATAMTTGIQIFWPLSKRNYSLLPLRPSFGEFRPLSLNWKMYKRFVRYYFRNKSRVLIETIVSILGLAALL